MGSGSGREARSGRAAQQPAAGSQRWSRAEQGRAGQSSTYSTLSGGGHVNTANVSAVRRRRGLLKSRGQIKKQTVEGERGRPGRRALVGRGRAVGTAWGRRRRRDGWGGLSESVCLCLTGVGPFFSGLGGWLAEAEMGEEIERRRDRGRRRSRRTSREKRDETRRARRGSPDSQYR